MTKLACRYEAQRSLLKRRIGDSDVGRRSTCSSPAANSGRGNTIAQPALLLGGPQHREEHLPCEQRLRRETEDDVDLLTEQVVPPGTHLLVLQHHVDREAVEEDEEREDDAVHETGRRCVEPRRPDVDHDSDPWDDARKAAEPERQPARLAWYLVLLHEQAEEDHASVDAGDGQQGADVADAGELRDQHDHDRGAEEVLDPASVVAVLEQVALVPRKDGWGRNDQQSAGRDREERHHAPAGGDIEQVMQLGRGAGRTGHERACHREREVVGERRDHDRLRCENQPDGDVPDAQPIESAFDGLVNGHTVPP
jgi:hypothetical protein